VLHAELHGKLSADADDAVRREDVLTSTVFGTLLAANAWHILLDWLSRAQSVRDGERLAVAIGDERRYWFWPYLDGAEPDLLLRIGALLAIVEAKYNSGKSGGAGVEPAEESKDQLVREWHACSPAADHARYPRDLCEAIQSCDRALIYLVRRARWAKAIVDARRSSALNADARIYLLTWEDLDEALAPLREITWIEMRMYLQRRGLAAFRGFHRVMAAQPSGALGAWSRVGTVATPGFRAAFSDSSLGRLRDLSSHRASGSPTPRRLLRTFAPDALGRIADLAARKPRVDGKERHG
jgi:hypothetical protein